MTAALIGVGWVVCGVLCYHLLREDWIRTLDWTRSTRTVGIAFSLFGPASLLVGLIVFIAGMDRGRADEVLKERKR